MSPNHTSALSLSVLSLAIGASIATSPPITFQATQSVPLEDINLYSDVPSHPITVTIDADPVLQQDSDQYWHLNFFLDVENRTGDLVNLSLWEIADPWSGGELPETAVLIDEAQVRSQSDETPTRVTLSDWDIPQFGVPTTFVLVADAEMNEIDLYISGEVTMITESWNPDIPNEASFFMTVE